MKQPRFETERSFLYAAQVENEWNFRNRNDIEGKMCDSGVGNWKMNI
jgi:hypothetical protein